MLVHKISMKEIYERKNMNPDLFIGKTIGNFKIKKKIGEGAFSIVFLAEEIAPRDEEPIINNNELQMNHQKKGFFTKHKKLPTKKPKQKVYSACKIIPRKKVEEKKLSTRLDHEIRVHQLMHHPNVVQLIDLQSDPSYFYVFLEFCPCGELFDIVVQNKRLPEDRAAFFFKQILLGLDYIHSLNVAHRDLKPENTLVDQFGRIKIADFGLSKILENDSNGLTKTPCGSPCYVSPETISGKPYDGRKSDIWSCGVILYAMTIGNLPWTKRTQKQLFHQIRNAQFAVPDFVSDPCADLICKLMTVNNSKRITVGEALKHPFLKDVNVPNYEFEWKFVSLRKIDRFLGFDVGFEYKKLIDHLSLEKIGWNSEADLNFLKIRKNIIDVDQAMKKRERLSAIVQSRSNARKVNKKFDRKARIIIEKIEPLPTDNRKTKKNETHESDNNNKLRQNELAALNYRNFNRNLNNKANQFGFPHLIPRRSEKIPF